MLERSLQAIADGTRRAILQRLAHGHATVGQLASLFPISRPAVSQHLKVLKDAGLVQAVGPGRLSAYELAPAPLLEIEHWVSTLALAWAQGPLSPVNRNTRSTALEALMTLPVTYVEINSPDLDLSAAFFTDVFDWQLRAFAAPGYLVAAADDGTGVDTGLMGSADGAPRSIPVIRVPSLEGLRTLVENHGGTVVVEPFAIAGVGRGCYILDPAGVLVGCTNTIPWLDERPAGRWQHTLPAAVGSRP